MLNVDDELDRQRDVLLTNGWPALVGLDEHTCCDAVDALRPKLRDLPARGSSHGQAPFVLVPSGGAARDMTAAEQLVHALVDVERGEEFCGIPPHDVLEKNTCFMLANARLALAQPFWGGNVEPPLSVGVRPAPFAEWTALLMGLRTLINAAGLTRSRLLPTRWLPHASWVMAAYLDLNTIGNAASTSDRERLVVTPLAVVVVACAARIALESDRQPT